MILFWCRHQNKFKRLEYRTVSFDINNNNITPFRKRNTIVLCVNVDAKHTTNFINTIFNGIECKLTRNSHDINEFKEVKRKNRLKRKGCNISLTFIDLGSLETDKKMIRTETKNIIYVVLTFNAVKTQIGSVSKFLDRIICTEKQI